MTSSILLYHNHSTGQIAFPSISLQGEVIPIRAYNLIDHMVEVTGKNHVVLHDVDILRGLGYTLATASQQEAYAAGKRKNTMMYESVATVNSEEECSVTEPEVHEVKQKRSYKKRG